MTTTSTTAAAKPPREHFRLGADLLPVGTVNGRRCILLATMGKGPHKGKRGTIGGHLERGDTFVTAVLREAEEEGNFKLTAADLIPLMVVDEPDRDIRDGVRGVGVAFMVDADALVGLDPVAGDDVAHVEWVPADELAEAIATGAEQFAYDHAGAIALACRIVANPELWPPKPRLGDEDPLLLFPIAAAAMGRQS